MAQRLSKEYGSNSFLGKGNLKLTLKEKAEIL